MVMFPKLVPCTLTWPRGRYWSASAGVQSGPRILSSCSNASPISLGLQQPDPQKGLNKLLQPELVNRLEAVGREGRGEAGEQEAV